jgi:hypothetical protein
LPKPADILSHYVTIQFGNPAIYTSSIIDTPIRLISGDVLKVGPRDFGKAE